MTGPVSYGVTVPLTGKTILVLEESGLIRMDLCDQVRTQGGDPKPCASIADALATLPGIAGAIVPLVVKGESTEALRLELKAHAIPLVIYTGLLQDEWPSGDHIFAKPAFATEIVAGLAEEITKHQ